MRSGRGFRLAVQHASSEEPINGSSHIEQAIARSQLELYYQPQVNLVSGAVRGLESLIRLRRSSGVVGAASEALGLVRGNHDAERMMTKWVIDSVADSCCLMRKVGISLPVAINISPVFLLEDWLEGYLTHAVDSRNLSRSEISIELTENGVINPASWLQIQGLRARSFKVCIDDFGAGSASVNYLNNVPVDQIKIDRRYVRNANNDPVKKIVLKFLLDVCGEMGVEALAEGIEDYADESLAKSLGYQYGQGYLFARPMPLQSCISWICQNRQNHVSKGFS